MNSLNKKAKGIFQKEGELVFKNDELDFLFPEADNHPRSRSRILIHKDQSSIPQEMIIAFNDKSIVEVSTHTFSESLSVLEGVAKYIFYNKSGQIIEDVILSPYSEKGTFYCFIPQNTFHRFIPYTKYSLAHEIGFSTFSSEFTKLFLEKPFDKISKVSNEDYSLEPRVKKNKEISLQINNQKDLYICDITPEITTLSYEDIKEKSSLDKPTLFSMFIDSRNKITDNIVHIPPNKEINFSNDDCVKTVSVLSGELSLELSSKEKITKSININNLKLFSSFNSEFIKKMTNKSPNESVVVKFVNIKK